MTEDKPDLQLVEEPEPGRIVDIPGAPEQDVAKANLAKMFASRGKARKEKFERKLHVERNAEIALAKQMNRAGALRTTVDADGRPVYFGACACKWHGLRVGDPELALREYDAHPCTISLFDDGPIDRELKLVDGERRVEKRPASALALNTVLSDGTIINGLNPVEGVGSTSKATTADEDQEKRFSLLELK